MFITKSLTKAFKFTTHLKLEVNLNKMKGEVNSRHQYEMFCYNQVICTSQSALLEIEDGGNFITSCSSWYRCCCSCCNWSLVRMPFPWTYSSNAHETEFPEEVCVVCTQNKRRKESWYQCGGLPWEARTLCCTMFLAVPHTTWPQQPLNFVFFIINTDCLQ